MSTTAEQLTPADVDPPKTMHVPTWRAVVVAVILAVALGVVAGTTAFVAQSKANSFTDRRLAALERDLNERRKLASEANARRDQQIAETRRLVCTVVNRLQPRDDEVERIRREFKCDQQGDPGPVTSPAR